MLGWETYARRLSDLVARAFRLWPAYDSNVTDWRLVGAETMCVFFCVVQLSDQSSCVDCIGWTDGLRDDEIGFFCSYNVLPIWISKIV